MHQHLLGPERVLKLEPERPKFDRYYCLQHFFRSNTLEKLLQNVLFTCTYNVVEKHVTCENDASMAKTNVTATVMTSVFNWLWRQFYDGPVMLIRKTAKPCINSTLIALLIHGFVLVKTWLLVRHSFLCNNRIWSPVTPFLFMKKCKRDRYAFFQETSGIL